MDWLLACYSSIICKTQVVKFLFSNKSILELKGDNLCLDINLCPSLKIEK